VPTADKLVGNYGDESKRAETQHTPEEENEIRDVFLPLDHTDGTNPEIPIDSPFPGVFVFKFSEQYVYANATHYTNQLIDYIEIKTKRTSNTTYPRLGDRPWNFKGPRHLGDIEADPRPTLRAIILDFSAVNNVDITSIQQLIDARNTLDRYAAPNRVDWHFASISSRWTKRALASAGFGYLSNVSEDAGHWKPLYSVAEVGRHAAGIADIPGDDNSQSSIQKGREADAEAGRNDVKYAKRRVLVHSINRPLFHVDVNAALLSVEENLDVQS